LAGAGPRALILIDEIGGGTEPNAGAALAIALLERFLARGARTVATTHAGELKLFGHSQKHVRNASVRFDPATYAPTYQLEIGAPGQSLALPLARAMQIEPDVVDRAESILSSSERDYERALAELATLQAQTAAQRDALAAERERLEKAEAEAERRRQDYEEERKGFARAAEGRLADTLRNFVRDLERRSSEGRRPKVTPGQSEALSRAIGELHRDLGLDRTRRADEAPATLAPGDRVIVGTLEQEGSIVAIDDDAGEATVQVGPMRMTVKRKDLRAATQPPPRRARTTTPAAEIAARAMPEIDVRGKRLIEAEPLVEQWLDEAALLGYSPLRLIHGKGTGLLGKGLQEYLKMHPDVRSFRYGNENEGGSGVTIVELRSCRRWPPVRPPKCWLTAATTSRRATSSSSV
ncbi:MAG: Smr/MutS family protein, partial [Vulcanimicrobiaceae bacterium]